MARARRWTSTPPSRTPWAGPARQAIRRERTDGGGASEPRACQAGEVTSTIEQLDADLVTDEAVRPDLPWQTIVWDDPVNLMTYVTYVFRSYFGYPREEAERLMLQVHHDGRAVVASGNREAMERHAQAMHGYGLQATVARAEA
ncbi:ATP-dependent Clp protease adapter ClpS [Agromyces tardus]|uniref:ATP-dependent Clp protease adapter protein ClpS n=1 Tax=Agromyces tardus TaxID=2583849 RepID=A0A3M8AJ90_9MICO|nr:ATP-dependent Clp protease adapter ClpS [Agromyces tardus]